MRCRPWLFVAASAAAQAPGDEKSVTTRALETGARLLQGNAPVAGMDLHLSGFHPLKDEPSQQMHAHHFCRQLNEELMQCALFDGSGAEARLNGIEYIVSERLYATLLRQRDQALDIDSAARRRDRASLTPRARPQHGVDALAPAFPGTTPIPGVRDAC